MKTTNRLSIGFFLVAIILTGLACSKDDSTDDEATDPEISGPEGEIEYYPGISTNDIEEYKGDIGLVFDTRRFKQKGYNTHNAKITVDATHNSFSKTIGINEYTNIAQLSFKIDSLTQEASSELKEGVRVELEIHSDDMGSVMYSEVYPKLSFKENGTRVDVGPEDIEDTNDWNSFGSDTSYFLNLFKYDGSTGPGVVQATDQQGEALDIFTEKDLAISTKLSQQFRFQAHPTKADTYYIFSAKSNNYIGVLPNPDPFKPKTFFSYSLRESNLKYPLSPEELTRSASDALSSFEFVIKKVERGKYLIYSNGFDLKFQIKEPTLFNPGGGFSLGPFTELSTKQTAYFRILSMNIDWDIRPNGIIQEKPILPPATTKFAFNSTLVNCTSSTISTEAGREEKLTVKSTVGFEETLSVYTTETSRTPLSIGLEAGATFFGVPGLFSDLFSVDMETSLQIGSEATYSEQMEKSKEETYFSKREIPVLPGKASLVYDSYQTYSNIEIPFVQRFTITGKDKTSNTLLSGKELETQISISPFDGVVTNIEDNFIEVSIRGTSFIENVADSFSVAREVSWDCEN
ncbi:hypothetical protein [Flagellimonas allohymeniacidonis]|uniref:Uncharacterized protein n=1 Tax=Flagellimonas allohymeniacidonis TaxID=2517819 RepID=A0A4Q8QD89_9FLAO|nr:hypothetical protein [Allomuricauda hymeniacidonis]TAI48355.1 hypothetical protein EW142_00665 [Allomuricauda hymeniacidonis]